MAHDLELVEAARARFRPARITTLFVGESAPASGEFFYFDRVTPMLSDMARAFEATFGEGGDVRERLKAFGWFVDDLSLLPVNAVSKAERKARCRAAEAGLAARIAEYQPAAIVSLLMRIKGNVAAAAIAAGAGDVPRHAIRFSRFGNLPIFLSQMAAILPTLPRL
jgi:hypothetical protein